MKHLLIIVLLPFLLIACGESTEEVSDPPVGMVGKSFALERVTLLNAEPKIYNEQDLFFTVRNAKNLEGFLVCNNFDAVVKWSDNLLKIEKFTAETRDCDKRDPVSLAGSYNFYFEAETLVLFSIKDGSQIVFKEAEKAN